MVLSHSRPYTGAEGNVPGFAGAGQVAQDLTQEACQGTDPPLAMRLPHIRVMQRRKGVQTPPFQSLSTSFTGRMSVDLQSPASPCRCNRHCSEFAWSREPSLCRPGMWQHFFVPCSSRDASPLMPPR